MIKYISNDYIGYKIFSKSHIIEYEVIIWNKDHINISYLFEVWSYDFSIDVTKVIACGKIMYQSYDP